MKKVLAITLLIMMVAGTASAVDMEGVDVRQKSLQKVSQMRSGALALSGRLSSLKSDLQDYIADYPDAFESTDITKLVAVNVDLTSCATACDVLATEILTQFPSIDA